MSTNIKDMINDVMVAIKRYKAGYAYSSSRGNIIRYSKKLVDVPDIKTQLEEYNSTSGDKINVEEAMSYITEAKEKVDAKNITRESHVILKMFDEVLVESANHLREVLGNYYNDRRNEFLNSNEPNVQTYARKIAIDKLPEELKNIDTNSCVYRTPAENELYYKRSKMISEYVQNNPVYQIIAPLRFDVRDTTKWVEWLDETIERAIESNKMKLYGTVVRKLKGLEIKTIESRYTRTGVQGFEGIFNLTLNDGTVKNFKVHSIYAGGYNIQCEHYRFLAKLK